MSGGIDLVALARQSNYFEIRTDPILGRRPRLEPELFSGGVNLTAQQRNRALLRDAARVYLMGRTLICAPWVLAFLRDEVQAAVAYVKQKLGAAHG